MSGPWKLFISSASLDLNLTKMQRSAQASSCRAVSGGGWQWQGQMEEGRGRQPPPPLPPPSVHSAQWLSSGSRMQSDQLGVSWSEAAEHSCIRRANGGGTWNKRVCPKEQQTLPDFLPLPSELSWLTVTLPRGMKTNLKYIGTRNWHGQFIGRDTSSNRGCYRRGGGTLVCSNN